MLKSIKKTLGKIDEIAQSYLSQRGLKFAETDMIKITLVQQTRCKLDKGKLEEYLSTQGKSVTEFQEEQEVEFIRRSFKK